MVEVKKPWGNFITLAQNQTCTVKIISIKKGHRTSLQCHQLRDEFWQVVKGKFLIEHNGESFLAHEGMDIYVKKLEKHRMKGLDDDNKIVEVSIGKFDEDDIMRIEDDYNRK